MVVSQFNSKRILLAFFSATLLCICTEVQVIFDVPGSGIATHDDDEIDLFLSIR